MKKSTRKAQFVNKNSAALERPLLMANPQAALALLLTGALSVGGFDRARPRGFFRYCVRRAAEKCA